MTAARRRRRKVLLIAGGIGITPLRALFETCPAGPGDLTLLYRASRERRRRVPRTSCDHRAAPRRPPAPRSPAAAPSSGTTRCRAAALAASVPDLREHDVYVCGPDPMAAAAVAALRAAGCRAARSTTKSFEF